MKLRITIGDWSDDGHGVSEQFVYDSNKTVKEIQDAYKASCKLTGLQFNHNANYTGLKEHDGYGSFRHICTEYEECEISEEALEILTEHGIVINFLEKEDSLVLYEDTFLQLLIDFIKLSLPDLELVEAAFKKSELKNIPAVNGWWNKDLNVQFGYGLYE